MHGLILAHINIKLKNEGVTQSINPINQLLLDLGMM